MFAECDVLLEKKSCTDDCKSGYIASFEGVAHQISTASSVVTSA